MFERPCKLWALSKLPNGYGLRKFRGKTMTAHRAAVIESGRDVPTGAVIRHACDNRACTEPTHLIVGTHHENAVDRAMRSPRSPTCKLTPDEVLLIRRLLGSMPQKDIALQFQVSKQTVSDIKHGKGWTHLQPD